jgi:DNA-binding response OmpR family regulator
VKALIVDDDRTLADLLAFTLRREGFEPHLAFDTRGAMEVFNRETVDIVILDVNLPGQPGLADGFDVCRAMRQVSDVPIILLTVRDEEADIVNGLNIGADDYVLKPFSPRQLMARVQSVLRRSSTAGAYQEASYSFGQLHFDPNLREVTWNEENPTKLTRLESRLLEYFMINAGQILPTENIIAHVWGPGGGSTEMLRQLVRRLRVKIERDPSAPALIANLPGVGYGLGV